MALNDVIKKARLKINLKQDDAAQLVGVTVQTYSKWENGKTEPKASQIAKLSKILNVSTNDICFGKESEKLELIEFMKMVSEISRGTSDFDLKMAIWESIENDYTFIENLRSHSSVPDRYLIAESNKTPDEQMYEAEKANDPEIYDERIEALNDHCTQQEEEKFVQSLDSQSRESYENIVNKHQKKEKTNV